MEEWEGKLEKAIRSARASVEMEGLSVSEETMEGIKSECDSLAKEEKK